MQPNVTSFFHAPTFTVCHVVHDPATRAAAVVDPVLDFDQKSGRRGTAFAEQVLAWIERTGLEVRWILETHAHADHLTAAPLFRERTGAPVAIGRHIVAVQETFRPIFNAVDLVPDGSQFDRLVDDGDRLPLGEMEIEAMHTPGHTPACVSYRVGDAVFVGDTLFMPDFGTARCDFPGGDARILYRSIRRLLALPPETRLFMCHDYAPGGRDYAWQTTVAAERAENRHVRDGIDEDTFVAMRQARDATLEMPVLILPSIQVNIRAGHLPPPDDNGTVYLRLPVDRL